MNEAIAVVVVDDHPIVRKGLTQLLRSARGMRCVGASDSGEQAVKMLNELHPDVVIVDIDLPGMSGIELTKAIKSSYPRIAVLLLSAYNYDAYISGCIESGADGYLLKTAHPEELIGAVHTIMRGGKVFDAAIGGGLSEKLVGPGQKFKGSLPLTKRETEILKLVAEGKSNKSISAGLGISEHTVGAHVANILEKLHVESRTEAALIAWSSGYVMKHKPS